MDSSAFATRIDLHVHSVASGHAFGTVQEIVSAANEIGLEAVGVADHGPQMVGAPHLGYFEMAEDVRRMSSENTAVLFGCEANILDGEGRIDLPAELLAGLDYVIAGLHARTPFAVHATTQNGSVRNTEAIIAAIESGNVDVIAHPVSDQYPVDVEAVVRAAARRSVALEINCRILPHLSDQGLKSCRQMVSLSAAIGCPLIVSSDAHTARDVGRMRGVEKVLDQRSEAPNLVSDIGAYRRWIACRRSGSYCS